jgi:hypothetical protein
VHAQQAITQCARMQGLGQAVAIARLGPKTLLAACPKAVNYNWFLDCSIPEHNDVVLMLIREAQADEIQNWYHLKLTGAHVPGPVLAAACVLVLFAAHVTRSFTAHDCMQYFLRCLRTVYM